jgi:hypothetical protein
MAQVWRLISTDPRTQLEGMRSIETEAGFLAACSDAVRWSHTGLSAVLPDGRRLDEAEVRRLGEMRSS